MATTSTLSLARTGYGIFVWTSSLLQPLVLLLLRLWGWQFMVTGWGKLNNHEKVVGFFTQLGIPMPGFNAWFVGGVECFGGILLLLGLLARPTALVLTINMLVAFLSVAKDRAIFFNAFGNPDTFIAADPFFYLLVAVVVLTFGPGLFSLDTLIGKLTPPRGHGHSPTPNLHPAPT
jgi:putative oxidoreductase